jgi:hypothetical protein
LVIYFADHPGEAERWLRHASQHCDRDVPGGEINRLLIWAEGLSGHSSAHTKIGSQRNVICGQAQPDLEEIYNVAARGPRLEQFRESSPEKLHCSASRNTDKVLDAWGRYAGQADPLICFGADERFRTRPHSALRGILHVHAQIVPSPMRARVGLTADGRWSEHSKDGTGERMFLVAEFDFAKTTPKGKPTIWGPLLERTETLGITVLDMQAAILHLLSRERPLWMTVFSGSKSLQGWFPCRGEDEEQLHRWFVTRARRLGACSSTWCKSQFVRLPDGTRAPNRAGKSVRQEIEFYNPQALL